MLTGIPSAQVVAAARFPKDVLDYLHGPPALGHNAAAAEENPAKPVYSPRWVRPDE